MTETSHWEEHPNYPLSDWQTEVANGDTRQSYREWWENLHDQVMVEQRQQTELRHKRIRNIATEQYFDAGDHKFDETSQVSEGEGNGAFVQCWVWASFVDTDLDKTKA
ncbi:MAG: hypothetical protein KJO60_11540 [Desulfofustis sp.]|nr:hypothetical protein [Desulfofustis sp.]